MFSLLKKKIADWIKKPKAEDRKERETEISETPEKDAPSASSEEPVRIFDKSVKARKSKKLVGEITDELEEALSARTKARTPRAGEIENAERTGAKETEIAEESKQKTRSEEKRGFFSKLKDIFSSYKITEEFIEESFHDLELILLESNVAVSVVDYIKDSLKKKLVGQEIKRKEIESKIRESLKETISGLLIESDKDIIDYVKNSPSTAVILFCGINGSGKTTTLAKIAYMLKNKGISCVFAASDTFRAASIEQLAIHGRNLGISIVKQTYGSDPAAVAFDAIQYAKARKIKAVLIDTAGRMHTKHNLMDEMTKIVRVAKPDLKIFVGESITGNDATEQARIFNESIDIDGIILTKADIDEKGGTAISVSKVTGKPILYLGTGQNYEDLEKFDKSKVLAALGL